MKHAALTFAAPEWRTLGRELPIVRSPAFNRGPRVAAALNEVGRIGAVRGSTMPPAAMPQTR